MTSENVIRAMRRANELLNIGDEVAYKRCRQQIRSFLDGYGKSKVRDLSEAEAEDFLRKFGNPPSAPRGKRNRDRKGTEMSGNEEIVKAACEFVAVSWPLSGEQVLRLYREVEAAVGHLSPKEDEA